MIVYSLVGKKLVECTPDELIDSPVGMIVDEKEEMIRLIVTPDARKKQRETLMQQSADFNKKEYAGTYLVSHLENPSIINLFLTEMKDAKESDAKEKLEPKKKLKKKKKKKKGAEEVEETETAILDRWNPEIVKKVVNFLDGKPHAYLPDIQKAIGVTEGEAYWVTQDLIYVGILPGRWIGYSDGQWVYQILSEQPLSKKKTKKPASPKKTTTSKSTKKTTKSTSKKK